MCVRVVLCCDSCALSLLCVLLLVECCDVCDELLYVCSRFVPLCMFLIVALVYALRSVCSRFVLLNMLCVDMCPIVVRCCTMCALGLLC